MRTAHSPEQVGAHPLVLTDATGATYQHLRAGDFLIYDHEDQSETPFHRQEAWWDMRMTRQVNPETIVFPVSIVWERLERMEAAA